MENQRKFYSTFMSFNCPNCGCNFQALIYNELGEPVDIDWSRLAEIYNEHNAKCSAENPWTDDPNVYYGDREACYPTVQGACPY